MLNHSRTTIFEALMDLTGLLNRSDPDFELLNLAGVVLDRALLPILVRIGKRGPIGIGQLADLCGRDYTTVSRQVSKLGELGLVARSPNANDGRVKEAALTESGIDIARALDEARDKRLAGVLEDWSSEDVDALARLMRLLADDAAGFIRRAGIR